MAKKQVEEFVIEDGVLLRYNGRSKVVTIPDEVVEIGAGAFVKKIKVFGEEFHKMTEIPSRRGPVKLTFGFRGMLSKILTKICGIKSVTMSDNVVGIANNAFEDCISLKTIKFSKNLEWIADEAFNDCENIKEIIFDKDCPLVNIGVRAFRGCKRLRNVQLPDSLCAIEEGAFWHCGRLKAIKLPDSVLYIGPLAFSDCTNLEYIYKSDNSQLFIVCEQAFSACKLRQFEVTKNLMIIGAEAFSMNEKIKEFTVPKHVIFYGKNMFWNGGGKRDNCKTLKKLYFENRGSWIRYDEESGESSGITIFSGTPKETARQRIGTIYKQPSILKMSENACNDEFDWLAEAMLLSSEGDVRMLEVVKDNISKFYE